MRDDTHKQLVVARVQRPLSPARVVIGLASRTEESPGQSRDRRGLYGYGCICNLFAASSPASLVSAVCPRVTSATKKLCTSCIGQGAVQSAVGTRNSTQKLGKVHGHTYLACQPLELLPPIQLRILIHSPLTAGS